MIQTVNPSSGRLLKSYAEHTSSEVTICLERAVEAFALWRLTSFAQRAEQLLACAAQLDKQRDELASLMAEEMGKPLNAGLAEVDKCAWVLRHYAEQGESYLAPQTVETDASRSLVRCDPLGPVLAVMPWNFPLWQVFRYAAPALMAGNVCVLKHASNVSGCAMRIEALWRDAGLPSGCFRTLLIAAARVDSLIDDDRIRAVTLTGSDAAGRAVAACAGRNLKKVVLELGGSDAFIVLEDADVEQAARVGATSRMLNTGQSCIAAKRFIVEDAVQERFVAELRRAISEMPVGDPLDPSNAIGPLARADLLDELEAQVDASLKAGARALLGGKRSEREGFFFEPTLLVDVTPEMPVATEETFGPVAAVLSVSGADQALELANGTELGLGASLWTTDLERADSLIPRIEAGSVFVNGLVKSDPRLPFGGIKASGFGRELGREGIREFVNVKSVWIA